MSKSLQDQLQKSGLINENKAKQVKSEQHKKKKKKKKKNSPEEDASKVAIKQQLAEKKQRDAELNRQQQEQAEAKAIQAQIKQLIEMNTIDREKGEVAFSFADNQKVKKLYVTSKLQDLLSRGRLAIVRSGNEGELFELVPTSVAEKINQRDGSWVVFIADAKADTENGDDPYADYQIPDDLMW